MDANSVKIFYSAILELFSVPLATSSLWYVRGKALHESEIESQLLDWYFGFYNWINLLVSCTKLVAPRPNRPHDNHFEIYQNFYKIYPAILEPQLHHQLKQNVLASPK